MHRVRTVASLGLFALNTGCSFFFVRTPPSDVSDVEATRIAPDCTSSSTLPALDVGGAVASGLNVAIVGSADRYTEEQKQILVPLHVAYGALYAISAVYGFHQTGKCRELKEKFERHGAEWKPALKTDAPQWTPVLKTEPPKAPPAVAPAPPPPVVAPTPPPRENAEPRVPTQSFPID